MATAIPLPLGTSNPTSHLLGLLQPTSCPPSDCAAPAMPVLAAPASAALWVLVSIAPSAIFWCPEQLQQPSSTSANPQGKVPVPGHHPRCDMGPCG